MKKKIYVLLSFIAALFVIFVADSLPISYTAQCTIFIFVDFVFIAILMFLHFRGGKHD